MSKNLKDILKSGEEQYDAKAWEKLSHRLDTVMPLQKKPISLAKKIFAIGTSVILIALISYVINNKDTRNTIEKASQYENTVKSDENKTEFIQNQKEVEIKSKNPAPFNPTKNTSSENLEKNLNVIKNHLNKVETVSGEKNLVKEEKTPVKNSESVFPIYDVIEFKKPLFDAFYCVNQEVLIDNKNFESLQLLKENGDVVAVIKANSKQKITLSEEGNYFVRYANAKTEEAFKVNPVEKLDFSYESELIYENGIPYIHLKTQDFTSGTIWKTNKGSISKQAESTKLAAFKKGTYEVKLEKTDKNKCVSSKMHKVEVNEEYNLLAPNAFIPKDNDSRKNSFMPFALTQRNVKFDLIIINPENGRTIFKSSSAENKWDGIDMNTGQMASSLKSFIWKVSIYNPEPGEKSDYSGSITIIDK